MKVHVYCSNFDKTEAIENAITHRVDDVAAYVPASEIIKLEVVLKIDNSKLKRGRDSYSCSLIARTKNLGSVFLNYRDIHLYRAIHLALEKMRFLIAKKYKKRIEALV